MNATKRKKLEAAGFKTGSAADFPGLTSHETSLIEARLALANALRSARESAGMSQSDLADFIGSSQSRIAKAEASDPGISTDLLLRAIFGTGVQPAHLFSRKVARREGVRVTKRRPSKIST